MSNNAGYVYVLSNMYMPGIVKIGRSINGGFGRAKTLYSGDTGVPYKFRLEFEMFCENCVAAERSVHSNLEEWRINKDREFFKVDRAHAIQEIIAVIASECYGMDAGPRGEITTVWDFYGSYGEEVDFIFKTANRSMEKHHFIEAIEGALTQDAVNKAATQIAVVELAEHDFPSDYDRRMEAKIQDFRTMKRRRAANG